MLSNKFNFFLYQWLGLLLHFGKFGLTIIQTKSGDFCTKLINLIATNTSNIQKTFSIWMLLRFRTLATNHGIPYLGNKQFLDLLKSPFPEIQNLLDALGRSTPITLILKAEGPTGYEDFVTFGICLDAAATAWSIIWAVATPASSVLTSSCLILPVFSSICTHHTITTILQRMKQINHFWLQLAFLIFHGSLPIDDSWYILVEGGFCWLVQSSWLSCVGVSTGAGQG